MKWGKEIISYSNNKPIFSGHDCKYNATNQARIDNHIWCKCVDIHGEGKGNQITCKQQSSNLMWFSFISDVCHPDTLKNGKN